MSEQAVGHVEGRPLRRQLRRAGSRREITHKVKVSAAQEAVLVERANARSITVSRLLVESALAGGADAARVRADLAGEVFRITRLLGRVSLNINQIAKVANATGRVPPEAPHAIGAITRTTERLAALFEGPVEGPFEGPVA